MSKFKLVPVLGTVTTCGSGSGPPKTLVKAMALIWLITLVPTVTLTGTETLPPDACEKTSSPTKFPGTTPPPGRLATEIDTVSTDGATPLGAETLSQLDVSDVDFATDQLNEPEPPFWIGRSWLVITVPLVFIEKLSSPG